MGFDVIYRTPISGVYVFVGSNLEKCRIFLGKQSLFRADPYGWIREILH